MATVGVVCQECALAGSCERLRHGQQALRGGEICGGASAYEKLIESGQAFRGGALQPRQRVFQIRPTGPRCGGLPQNGADHASRSRRSRQPPICPKPGARADPTSRSVATVSEQNDFERMDAAGERRALDLVGLAWDDSLRPRWVLDCELCFWGGGGGL